MGDGKWKISVQNVMQDIHVIDLKHHVSSIIERKFMITWYFAKMIQMAKLTLNIDPFILEQAKASGMNISAFVEDQLAEKLGYVRKWVKKE